MCGHKKLFFILFFFFLQRQIDNTIQSINFIEDYVVAPADVVTMPAAYCE